MGILDRISAWIRSFTDPFWQSNFGKALSRALDDTAGALLNREPGSLDKLGDLASKIPTTDYTMLATVIAALTGKPTPQSVDETAANFKKWQDDPEGFFVELSEKFGTDPNLNRIQETIGRIMENVMVTPLENAIDDADRDPHELVRLIHGKLAALIMTTHVASLAAEIAGLGQVKSVGLAVSDLLIGMGITRVGFRSMSALLDIGVSQPLERYYNKRYRPRRWTLNELTSLYALNEITASDLHGELSTQGYRDQDIELAVRLAQQRIGIGDVLEAYSLGKLSTADALSRIREKGFRTEDSRFLVELEDLKRTQVNRDAIVGIARVAYKKQLISSDRFRGIMVAAKYPDERIDLELSVGSLEIDGERRDLNVGQVKEALSSGVLQETEARTYLQRAGLDADAVNILLATWKAEAVPDVVRLNANTISAAYVDAVFDRGTALSRLLELGWNPGDAEVILRIADQRIAERQRRESLAKPRPLAVNEIESAFKEKVVTEAQALDLLRGLRLVESDARIVLDTWKAEQVIAPRSLSESGIVAAYRVGVLTRDETKARLVSFGLPEEEAELLLETADEEIIKQQQIGQEAASRAATVPVLRSAYFQDIIDATRLRAELTALGAGAALIDLLVATWDAERATSPARLSSAAIGAAYAAALVTRARASELLAQLGLGKSDADLVLQIVERNFAERNPHPTGEAVIKAYANKLLTYDHALRRLKDLGYDDAQAAFLLRAYDLRPRLSVKQLSEGVVIKLFRLGEFDIGEAVDRLMALGYDEQNAELLLLAETTAAPKAAA